MRSILLASVLVLAVASPIRGQESLAVLRLVMARGGGPIPIGESAVFYPTDAKVVAWARFASSAQMHAVVFRWFDPDGRLQRVSPSHILPRGKEFTWDHMLIRGRLPANRAGRWTVKLYVDGVLLAATRFDLLADGTPSPQRAWLRRDRTQVVSLSREAPADDSYSISRIFSYPLGPGFSAQMGFEASRTPNAPEIPLRQIDAGGVFLDLRYTPPYWPSISLSFRHEREVDDRAFHVTDSGTTTWTLSSSYFRGRFSFNGSYSMQGVDDRTTADADFFNRTLILTAAYALSPHLSLSVARTSLAQDFQATPLLPAFTQGIETTLGRLTYQPTPNLSVALFTLETVATRSDTLVTSSISRRGLEAAYRVNARLSFTVLTQWQEQTTVAGGVASISDQWMTTYGANFFLPQDLTIGLTYSPQVTAAGPSVTRAEILTAYVNFSPSPRLFLTGTYALARTAGAGVDAISKAWTLSMRYAPTSLLEFQGTARVNDAEFPLFPTTNTSTATFLITAIWRF